MKRMAALLVVLTLSLGPAHAAERNCAWQTRIDPTAFNSLYPDQFANYWVTTLPAVPGARLQIAGRYPHARYISFVSYAATLSSADGLADVDIAPDLGSTNPFLPAADRTVSARDYTVQVRFLATGEARPAQREPNTLYTSNADASKRGDVFNVIYRVYRSDAAYGNDIAGGVGLPAVTYIAPDGSRTDIPTCSYQDVPPNPLNEQIANAGQENSNEGRLHHPGFNPPRWHKFYNFARSLSQGLTEGEYSGTSLSDAARPVAESLPPGGFADNPDNNYVFSLLSHGWGQIAVFRAKLPATPDTYPDAPVMQAGAQLRYWSMCSNDGPSQRYFGCVMDDQVRPTVDAERYYTLVVSTPADRPATADAAHGVTWLPWGPGGSVVLIMRNMLADARFANSIQKALYDHEAEDLGAYYPHGCYLAAAAFDSGIRCSEGSQ
jgi:hypothetical protein